MYWKALGVVLALGAQPVFANNEWASMAESKDGLVTYEAKVGSWKLGKNRAGKQISSILGRVKSARDDTVEFQTWYVTLDDCERGMGKLTSLKISGEFKFDSDFVIDGGSIASGIASTLCALVKVDSKSL